MNWPIKTLLYLYLSTWSMGIACHAMSGVREIVELLRLPWGCRSRLQIQCVWWWQAGSLLHVEKFNRVQSILVELSTHCCKIQAEQCEIRISSHSYLYLSEDTYMLQVEYMYIKTQWRWTPHTCMAGMKLGKWVLVGALLLCELTLYRCNYHSTFHDLKSTGMWNNIWIYTCIVYCTLSIIHLFMLIAISQWIIFYF